MHSSRSDAKRGYAGSRLMLENNRLLSTPTMRPNERGEAALCSLALPNHAEAMPGTSPYPRSCREQDLQPGTGEQPRSKGRMHL